MSKHEESFETIRDIINLRKHEANGKGPFAYETSDLYAMYFQMNIYYSSKEWEEVHGFIQKAFGNALDTCEVSSHVKT